MNTTEERFVVWAATLLGGIVLLTMPFFLDLNDLFAVLEMFGGVCLIAYALWKLYGIIRLPDRKSRKTFSQ